MSTKTTFILFGSTNGYQADRSGIFRGRTRIAHSVEHYITADEASRRLMGYFERESDNYIWAGSGDVQTCVGIDPVTEEGIYETIGSAGDMSYHHDGYSWEFIEVNDLTEEDARLALRCNQMLPSIEEVVYTNHPDLRPVEEADED